MLVKIKTCDYSLAQYSAVQLLDTLVSVQFGKVFRSNRGIAHVLTAKLTTNIHTMFISIPVNTYIQREKSTRVYNVTMISLHKQ